MMAEGTMTAGTAMGMAGAMGMAETMATTTTDSRDRNRFAFYWPGSLDHLPILGTGGFRHTHDGVAGRSLVF
jgi:hypothetical protein